MRRSRPDGPGSSAWASSEYRWLWFAQLVSNAGTNAQKVALLWLALVMSSSLAEGALLVGLVGGLRFVPMVLVGTRAGRLVDRHPSPRRLLFQVELFAAVVTGVGGALLVSGVGGVWVLALLSLLSGVALIFEPPALMVVTLGTVPPGAQGNAVASMALLYDIGKVAVPGLAGVLIALGFTPVLVLANAASCLVLAWVVRRGAGPAVPAPPVGVEAVSDPVPGRVRERRLLVLVAALSLPALEFATFLPLLAAAGASGRPDAALYGMIGLAAGVGSLVGGLACARWVRSGGPRLTLSVLGLYAVSLVLVAVSVPWVPFLLVSVALASALLSCVLSVAATTVQGTASPSERGRVASVWSLTVTGGTVVSAPAVGALTTFFGPPSALLLVASASLLVSLVAGLLLRRLLSPSLPIPLQRPGSDPVLPARPPVLDEDPVR